MQAMRTDKGALIFKLKAPFVNKLITDFSGYVTYKNFEKHGKTKVFVSNEDQKIVTVLGDLYFFKGYYIELI